VLAPRRRRTRPRRPPRLGPPPPHPLTPPPTPHGRPPAPRTLQHPTGARGYERSRTWRERRRRSRWCSITSVVTVATS
jgi:hypothetical protein